jgi:hypothetical protein
MPSTTHLRIYRGDDYAADIAVTAPDGTPSDLTGYTAQSQIRTGTGDTSPNGVAEFTTAIVDNVVTIVLDHDVTKDLKRSQYYWDLQITDAAGWITTLMAGQVYVTGEITKVYE